MRLLPKQVAWSLIGVAILLALQFGMPTEILAAATAIIKTGDLNFGKFAGGAGKAGTIIMSSSGGRSATGTVILITSTVSAAGFTITGNSGKAYTLTVPTTFTISSGTYLMNVTALTSSIPLTGSLPANGSLPFTVGGTLTVTSTQQNRTYSGSLDVSVK